MAVDDVFEVLQVDAELDALGGSTSSQVWRQTSVYSADAVAAVAARRSLEGGGGSPTGAAGGVLAGTYPNPSFASDLATQAELNAAVSDLEDAIDAVEVSSTAGVFNVMDYGAIGDGTTDDSAAVVAANAAAASAGGGDVYFPGGNTYVMRTVSNGQTVVTPGVGVRFVGGGGATIYNLGGPFDAVLINVVNPDFVIDGITFRMDPAHNQEIAVRLTNVARCTVRNCKVTTGHIFVYIVGSTNHLTIENNTVLDGYGILTHDSSTCHHITVRGNKFLGGSVGEGIEINTPTGSSSDWNIVGNWISGYTATGFVGGFGIAVAHADRVNIVGNYISDNVNAGIRFEDGCSDVNVVGNYLYNINEHGIYVIYGNSNAMENFLIHGNFLKTCGKIGTSWDTTRTDAIAVIAGGAGDFRGLIVSDNMIVDCGETGTSTAAIGFTSFGPTDCRISGNVIRGQLGNVAGATPGIGISGDIQGGEGNMLITDNIFMPVVSTDRGMNFSSTAGGTLNGLISGNGFLGSVVAINLAAGTWVVKDNIGIKTEANGATSIADGATITHGLGQAAGGLAPTVVTVTPSVASEMASVTAVSTTTFTVALRKQDGDTGTTQTVYWRASVHGG